MITRALSVAALALIAVAAQACAGTEESTASDEGAIHGADDSAAKPTPKTYAGRILYSEGQETINPVGIVVELTCNGKSKQTKTGAATFVEKDGRVTTLDPKRFGNKFEFELPESTAGCTIRVKDGTDRIGERSPLHDGSRATDRSRPADKTHPVGFVFDAIGSGHADHVSSPYGGICGGARAPTGKKAGNCWDIFRLDEEV